MLGLLLPIQLSWSKSFKMIMLRTLAAWAVLGSFLTSVLGATVEDSDVNIHWDDTWSLDMNGYNSGGSAHHTNITGGKATYSFTGKSTLQNFNRFVRSMEVVP